MEQENNTEFVDKLQEITELVKEDADLKEEWFKNTMHQQKLGWIFKLPKRIQNFLLYKVFKIKIVLDYKTKNFFITRNGEPVSDFETFLIFLPAKPCNCRCTLSCDSEKIKNQMEEASELFKE